MTSDPIDPETVGSNGIGSPERHSSIAIESLDRRNHFNCVQALLPDNITSSTAIFEWPVYYEVKGDASAPREGEAFNPLRSTMAEWSFGSQLRDDLLDQIN